MKFETKANDNIVENPEPDWSLTMFWEDITAVLIKLLDLIRSLFNYA